MHRHGKPYREDRFLLYGYKGWGAGDSSLRIPKALCAELNFEDMLSGDCGREKRSMERSGVPSRDELRRLTNEHIEGELGR